MVVTIHMDFFLGSTASEKRMELFLMTVNKKPPGNGGPS